jgi:hypothetical protein
MRGRAEGMPEGMGCESESAVRRLLGKTCDREPR